MTTADAHPIPDRTTTLPLRPGRWEVDPHHTTVGFSIRHLGVARVRGRFSRFDAEVVIGETLESTSVTATVDLASVDSGNVDRDAHIRADDMLDVARRPTMSFRSTGVRPHGERWILDGELAIGDVVHPFSLEVELGGLGEFPVDGSTRAGFTATGELRRRDFGIAPGFPPPVLGDVVRVELDVELIEPA